MKQTKICIYTIALLCMCLTLSFLLFHFNSPYKEEQSNTNIDAALHTEALKTYILNVSTKKIHKDDCGTATLIDPQNRKIYRGDIVPLFEKGYTYCGNCFRGY